MGWPNTATAILALRNLIFDGPTHKMCSFKQVLGQVDGVNLIFKTFEYRRLTDFTTSVFPQGVFKDGVQLPANKITSDDLATGTFKIDVAVVPTNRNVLSATYFYQWFTDSEIDQFLQNSSSWLGYGTTYINLVDGLNASALRFAAQEAYEAAAMKYSTRMSEVYKLEDAPSEDILKSIEAFQKMADNFMDKATSLRDDFYTRQGQPKAPLFNLSVGSVIDPVPRR